MPNITELIFFLGIVGYIAYDDAFKNIISVNIKGSTIAHDIEVKYNASRVLLRPASEGTGVIAGGATRPVVELAGIKDILTKLGFQVEKKGNIQRVFSSTG